MTNLLQSSGEFVANFVPPSYLVDGFLLRAYLYALTAPTGHGKTSVALYIALMVALGRDMCGHEVEKCKVVYFAGENDSDIRMRWIKLCEENRIDPDKADVFFMPTIERLSTEKFKQRLLAEVEAIGPIGLMFVDTSAAYSEMQEENANMQILDHAKALRAFIKLLPGNPTVIVLCHPTKTPNVDNLLPRGGGAFLAEIDGNLVCKLVPGTLVVDIDTHGKFRGVDFEIMSFQLVSKISDKLKDTKGRHIPTVFARPLDDFARSEITDNNRSEQDRVLLVLLGKSGLSVADIAKKAGFVGGKGTPQKSRAWRLLKALKDKKLVDKDRSENYKLTGTGEKEAKRLKGEAKAAPSAKPNPNLPPGWRFGRQDSGRTGVITDKGVDVPKCEGVGTEQEQEAYRVLRAWEDAHRPTRHAVHGAQDKPPRGRSNSGGSARGHPGT